MLLPGFVLGMLIGGFAQSLTTKEVPKMWHLFSYGVAGAFIASAIES